jgi:hypothetical protein
MTRPFFTHDRISHFDIFDRHADKAIALMNKRLQVGLAIDFQVRVYRVDHSSLVYTSHRISSPDLRLTLRRNSSLDIALILSPLDFLIPITRHNPQMLFRQKMPQKSSHMPSLKLSR